MANEKAPGVALSIPTPAATSVQTLESFRDELGARVFTSLDVTTPTGKAQLLMAMQDATGNLGDPEYLAGQIVNVEHLLVHTVELADEDTGELLERDRIVILTPEGETLAAVSQGIRKSVQLLMAAYGLPPYSPPLRVRVRQVNTRRGKRLYQLVPVADVVMETPAAPSRKR